MGTDIGRYEVLTGDKFAHLTEPVVSFARRAVWINRGCLKRMPNIIYVHFLLLRQERKLIIKSAAEEQLDVVRWCTPLGNSRKIICHDDLWDDISSLMGWNENNRYRLLGRFIHAPDWNGFAFDMTRAEEFQPGEVTRAPLSTELASTKDSRANQTWEEYRLNPLISRFSEDTLNTFDEGEL